MAPSSLQLPIHSPPSLKSTLDPFFLFPLVSSFVNLGASSSNLIRRRESLTIRAYSKSIAGQSNEQNKRELLESYGLNPDEFLSESSQKSKRKKELQRIRRGSETSQQETAGSPRETHRLLQVLGGNARRKKLLSPKGMDVRPMMEVVKGAAFGILQVSGGCPSSLRPGRWLDLYSGTGSVGIEALSRGCSEVHFVEMDPWVISQVLQPNLEWTSFLDESIIHAVRVEKFLEQSVQVVGKYGTFDYISVTPPYTQVDYGVLMDQISKSSVVGEDTFILVEYPLGTSMLDSCGCVIKIADRRFGRTHLAIYGPKWALKKRKSEA
ncbi:putative rRNA methyltransferase YlbH [Impatiens glandulifera]|uniref:putative rRNA methyltransferase YlbH n=1 Tax=Impatiens glandulifera TaxID=253017 RepID=UPI001FB110EB|nr:putative rRNA methyltransferase YlbH [Impatiens glandulifera]